MIKHTVSTLALMGGLLLNKHDATAQTTAPRKMPEPATTRAVTDSATTPDGVRYKVKTEYFHGRPPGTPMSPRELKEFLEITRPSGLDAPTGSLLYPQFLQPAPTTPVKTKSTPPTSISTATGGPTGW